VLSNIAYYLILGKPLILYIGITTFLTLLAAASIPILNKYRKKIKTRWHYSLARIGLIFGTIRALLGILAYF
jgi:hypothetical protein